MGIATRKRERERYGCYGFRCISNNFVIERRVGRVSRVPVIRKREEDCTWSSAVK